MKRLNELKVILIVGIETLYTTAGAVKIYGLNSILTGHFWAASGKKRLNKQKLILIIGIEANAVTFKRYGQNSQGCCRHETVNPSNAEASFIQSTMRQTIMNTI